MEELQLGENKEEKHSSNYKVIQQFLKITSDGTRQQKEARDTGHHYMGLRQMRISEPQPQRGNGFKIAKMLQKFS